jgi:hypothetical protein
MDIRRLKRRPLFAALLGLVLINSSLVRADDPGEQDAMMSITTTITMTMTGITRGQQLPWSALPRRPFSPSAPASPPCRWIAFR